MTEDVFKLELNKLISDAEAQKDEGNVIEFKAVIPVDGSNDLIESFTTTEVNEAWSFVKNFNNWFIDFYECIISENRSEYIGITLFDD